MRGPPDDSELDACKLVVRIAGSDGVLDPATASPNEELIRLFSVGCDGREGNVGEGSLSRPLGCSGIAMLLLLLVLAFKPRKLGLPAPDRLRAFGKTDMDADRAV